MIDRRHRMKRSVRALLGAALLALATLLQAAPPSASTASTAPTISTAPNASTDASTPSVSFGARMLEIPAPEGFEGVAQTLPDYLRMSQAYLPPDHRLVDVYLTPEDRSAVELDAAPSLQRYFQLQVLRRMDGQPLSLTDFAHGLPQVEREIERSMPGLNAQAAARSVAGNAALQQQTGAAADASVRDVRLLGVFRREPWGIFHSVSSLVAASGADVGSRVISAGAVVLVNHQLLHLHAFADARDADAQRWAESAVGRWSEALQAANPPDAELAATLDPARGTGLDGRGAALLGAAVLVALFAFFAWRRRKRA